MATRKRKDPVQATEFIHCLLALNLRGPSEHRNSMYKNPSLCLLTMRAFKLSFRPETLGTSVLRSIIFT